jgi:fluoroquinolone transport system permease protein
MRRLLATLACDVRLQFRNGFYYAAGFVVALWLLLVSQLPALDWGWLLPAVVLNNLVISTFYFLAGLVLLEKGEGTLEALVVTPLRRGEYLLSKVATLGVLALLENLAIVMALVGLRFGVLMLVLGTVLAAWIFCLVGFLAVIRYGSINEFLLPSMPYVIALFVPLLPYFGVVESPLFYLHPVYAPLLLLVAAFQPVDGWWIAYGIVYSAVWIALLHALAKRAFERFVALRLTAA